MSAAKPFSVVSRLFSPVRFQGWLLKSLFRRCGLKEQEIQVANGSVSCWRGGRGRPLLLLHGFGASAMWQWARQVRPLAQRHELIVPDLMYFGGSRSNKKEWSLEFQVEAMIQLLDELNLSSVDVLGLSYGGLVANLLAVTHPERVRKLILVDSPGWEINWDDHQRMLRRFGVDALHEFLLPDAPDGVRRLINIAWHKPPSIPGFALRDAYRVLFCSQVEEKKALLHALMDPLKNKDRKMDLPKQETLVLWGAHDQIFPVELGKRFFDTLGEAAQLVVIKGAGHAPNLEKSSEFNFRVLEFLEQ